MEPLLAIADAAGQAWPKAVRRAAVVIFGSSAGEDQNIGVQLLADIRTIFHATTEDKITSADLVNKLKEVETSPWADWGKGKTGLTVNGLSRLLKPFGIGPRGTIRVDAVTAKGYLLESFEDAFSRYLPSRSLEADLQPSHPSQPASLLIETHIFEPSQKAIVTVEKSASDPHEHCIVTDVTVQNPPSKGGATKGGGIKTLSSCSACGSHAVDPRTIPPLCFTCGYGGGAA
jgi:hypothetical protein